MKTLCLALIICACVLTAAAQTTGEAATTAAAIHKTFAKPDEVREFPLGKLELVNVGGVMIGRATFQPGWKWSTSLKEASGTESCEAPHFQYHVAGVLHVKMDDGTEFDLKPGDVSMLPSGHDAWVVGDEPAVVVDWHGMTAYAGSK